MASMQCYEPADKSCHQAQQGHSIGEKILGMASSVFKGHDAQSRTECYTKTETRHTNLGTMTVQTKHCHSQTQPNPPNHGHHHASHGVMTTSQAGHCIGQTNGQHQGTNGKVGCHERTAKRSTRKRGLLQKIKDGISRDSDSSSSSSSSESESDDEKQRGTRKSC